MFERLKLVSLDQWFLIVFFVLSLILAFLLGYTTFRYWQVEICQPAMEVIRS